KETPKANNPSPKISKPVTPKPSEQTQKSISNPILKNTEPKITQDKKPEQPVTNGKQEKKSWPKRFLFWLANLF
ncbi:MAG: hypothetical protein CEO19_461, partial [Parcubacteria group bacterium Gr01-1014_73]